MAATLVVPQTELEALQAFVTAQRLPIQLATQAPGQGDFVRVERGDRGRQSQPELLVAGGRIRCAVALGMAKRLGLPALGLGALIDELDIKVGSCSLGCF
jgi:hypothetical protein